MAIGRRWLTLGSDTEEGGPGHWDTLQGQLSGRAPIQGRSLALSGGATFFDEWKHEGVERTLGTCKVGSVMTDQLTVSCLFFFFFFFLLT